jgi:dihydropteroate synthase
VSARSRILQIGAGKFNLHEKALILGVLNVTPDSFSDGGKCFDCEAAVHHALRMEAEGADIIDIGGESTRPYSTPVSEEEELRRVIPVIEGIRRHSAIPISIDTTKAVVARRAVGAGADMLNDISGLTRDREMLNVLRNNNLPVIIMHSKGTPAEMQLDPHYDDLMGEISQFLGTQAELALAAGAQADGVFIDPGIGFGKTVEHNFTLLQKLGELRELGYPVAVGPSRKSFIGRALGLDIGERLEATLAAAAVAICNGASMVRLHDIREGRRAVDLAFRIREAGE